MSSHKLKKVRDWGTGNCIQYVYLPVHHGALGNVQTLLIRSHHSKKVTSLNKSVWMLPKDAWCTGKYIHWSVMLPVPSWLCCSTAPASFSRELDSREVYWQRTICTLQKINPICTGFAAPCRLGKAKGQRPSQIVSAIWTVFSCLGTCLGDQAASSTYELWCALLPM